MNSLKTLLILTALLAGSVHAQSTAKPADVAPATKTTSPSANMAEGEVRKVDKEAKKITIKHGEIKSLNMPPMSMVFQVKDPALLETVKAGDKIRFQAEQTGGGAIVVTDIQPVK